MVEIAAADVGLGIPQVERTLKALSSVALQAGSQLCTMSSNFAGNSSGV